MSLAHFSYFTFEPYFLSEAVFFYKQPL